MIEVGALLALQIDSFAESRVSSYPHNYLNSIITTGRAHVGRILHYYPFN